MRGTSGRRRTRRSVARSLVLAPLAMPLLGCETAVLVASGGFIVGPSFRQPQAPPPGQGTTLGALSPDGRLIAFRYFASLGDPGGRRPILYDWQADRAWRLPAGPETSLEPFAFAATGDRLFVKRERRVATSRGVDAITLPGFATQNVLEMRLPSRGLALHPDGRRLVLDEWNNEARATQLVMRSLDPGQDDGTAGMVVMRPPSGIRSLAFLSASELLFVQHDRAEGTPRLPGSVYRLRLGDGAALPQPLHPPLSPATTMWGAVAAPGEGDLVIWTAPGQSSDPMRTLAYYDLYERRGSVTRRLSQEGWAQSQIIVSRSGDFVAYLEAANGDVAATDLVILQLSTGRAVRPRVVQRLQSGRLRAMAA